MSLSAAIERACRFLEKMQWQGEFWIDFEWEVGLSSQWVTAYVAHCLARANPASGALPGARDYLLRTPHAAGGWGFNRRVPPDADSTANVLLFLSRYCQDSVNNETLSQIADTLIPFQSASEDGGFVTYLWRHPRPEEDRPEYMYQGSGWCISHLSVTALAAVSLLTLGEEKYQDVLKAATDFVLTSQDPSGFWESYWWYDRVYGTYWACRLLLSMGYQVEPRRAAEWLLQLHQGEDGWGNGLGGEVSAFHTAQALGTLMLFENPPSSHKRVDRGIAWLLESQLPDGSWAPVPILLNPVPEVLVPWEDEHPTCHAPIIDQHRQFTTATVLMMLAEYRTRTE